MNKSLAFLVVLALIAMIFHEAQGSITKDEAARVKRGGGGGGYGGGHGGGGGGGGGHGPGAGGGAAGPVYFCGYVGKGSGGGGGGGGYGYGK